MLLLKQRAGNDMLVVTSVVGRRRDNGGGWIGMDRYIFFQFCLEGRKKSLP